MSSVWGQKQPDIDKLVSQPADIALSAYQYRADRPAKDNSPESWIGLMKFANLPFDKAVDVNAQAFKKVLCGLIWEEVRRVRQVELVWSGDSSRRPKAEDVAVTFFDAEVKDNIPTWWNNTVLREADKPVVSADGNTYTFTIPVDTFGLVVSVRSQADASVYEVPTVRAFAPEVWKQMDIEIEWGFDKDTANSDYSGSIEAYDGVLADIKPLTGDTGTSMKGNYKWNSKPANSDRRGISLRMLYIGTSKDRKVWPYNSEVEDVARTIITIWTKSGNFSFLASDLEKGPILAPEYGFFVRPVKFSTPLPQSASISQSTTAKEFIKELADKNLTTIRQKVNQHPEQTWENAVAARFPDTNLPATPKPEFETPMKVDVPSERLTAQWNLGAWHMVRHAVKNEKGQLRFNDHPYGILASETYMVLYVLDLIGMHNEAADGLNQWLGLPIQNQKPVGLFADGNGCLSQATGPQGVGGDMDGVHSMGPGAIMLPLVEHFRLTGDIEWLKTNAPRMKANIEWILRQRKMLADNVPGGNRLWCKGLQPPHQVTPDSGGQLMQFYESEAYYWLAVQNFADILTQIDHAEGARLAAEAKAYRKDLMAAVERSISLSPVTLVRDGTYRSFIPFACYVRGFASSAWSWRRPGSGGHVGGLYWDTIQSAEALISPAGLLAADDRRVQGLLDVLEDRLLLENEKVARLKKDFDPEKDWFSYAAWQYQPGLERHANIHLAGDDASSFLRSWLNQYAVLILPNDGYIFNEHTTQGPPDKIFEEAAFLERFRNMLVMEDGENLWLARATPRVWLEQGKKISVKNAPTWFGTIGYEIVSDVDKGKITAKVELPSKNPPKNVFLRLRHPIGTPIKSVMVNDKNWKSFDKDSETILLNGLHGTFIVEISY